MREARDSEGGPGGLGRGWTRGLGARVDRGVWGDGNSLLRCNDAAQRGELMGELPGAVAGAHTQLCEPRRVKVQKVRECVRRVALVRWSIGLICSGEC